MTQLTDNPAARLHTLLLDLHEAHPRQQNQQRQAWHAICSLLGVQPDSPAGLQAVADVVRLPDEVTEAIGAHVDDEEEREHLLEGMSLIRNAMTVVVSRNTLQGMFECFAPGGSVPLSGIVRDLASCSRVLHRSAPTSALSDAELDHLKTLIVGLMDQVIETGLDAGVRLLLLAHLRKMLEAVQLVRVGGRAAIEEELDAVVGAVIRRPEAAVTLQRSGLLEKLKTWVATMNGLLTVGTGSTQLGQAVMRAIEM